ncbi:cation:proton antiporter [Bradyrhizobium sp. LMTR 3]|uniref:cation:proton antiporter domain-containing protein n=1 Tax=Bradyrhizobium sp. LMTR 3 TaxID=189873 RepID=UPI0008107C3E|nr:cation:proton antiporter [Bradyrhizobium sp. LMTR 3]OCK57893.1 potassium transporter [Bradyrhizobium sp. LMTR 3]
MKRGSARLTLWVIPVVVLTATLAEAAEDATRPSEFILILQIVLLITVGRGLGEIMQRIGQPSVVGELLAGLLLGPSLFGWVWPSAHAALFPPSAEQKALIEGLAQFGILLLLLLTGMETDLGLVRRVGRAAIIVSIAGIVVPFLCGFLLGQILPDSLLPHPEARLVASLFLGTALSISSVKIVAVVVREMNFMRRNVGQIIIAAAIIDDTIGWIIIAVIFSLASQGTLDLLSVGQAVAGTLIFLAVSFTIGRRLAFRLIRWANDTLVSASAVITVILLLMGSMALITHAIGVHTVLGAFVAGVLVGESPILTRQIDERLRGLITSLFMPVFFGLAGLNADLTVLKDPNLLWLTALLVLIASIGKFGGAFVGGSLGGMSRYECFALASGMNARGSTEVIIASIGLSMGVLSQNLFSMIVTMAILTTIAMPPMLRAALSRLPMKADERERLEREELEEKGFIANLERLLLAVDESANAKFASHLAGLLAGARGIPITVLHIGARAKRQEKKRDEEESHESAVRSAARIIVDSGPDEAAREIDVTTRAKSKKPADAIIDEARKGFDLLIVGTERVVGAKNGFDERIEDVTAGFDGPLAIVVARGGHLEQPAASSSFRILVPVSGSGASRRGADVAVALARAGPTSVRFLHVAATRDKGRRGKNASLLQQEAILRDTGSLAARYGIEAATAIRASASPEQAILREIESSGVDLVVLGADRVQSEKLSFGGVASSVLENSTASVLLISS